MSRATPIVNCERCAGALQCRSCAATEGRVIFEERHKIADWLDTMGDSPATDMTIYTLAEAIRQGRHEK